MKWKILHESKGRMRLHLNKPRMSLAEADQLQDYLAALPGVELGRVVALLGQLLQYLHRVCILEGVVGSRGGLGLEKHFLDVAQGLEAHLVLGLHCCNDVFAYLFK